MTVSTPPREWWQGKLKAFQRRQTNQSCVGYVAAKVIEGQLLFSGKPCQELSPEFLWNVARERDNTPYTPRSGIYDALLIATEYGAPPLRGRLLPGNEASPLIEDVVHDSRVAAELKGTDNPDSDFVEARLIPLLEQAKHYRISGVVSLGPWTEEWKHWVLAKGPLAVQINVTSSFDQVGMDPTAVVESRLPRISVDPSTPPSAYDSHAVVLVDYVDRGDADRSYFVVLNSFGPSWGKDGLAAITETDAEKVMYGAYGVNLISR